LDAAGIDHLDLALPKQETEEPLVASTPTLAPIDTLEAEPSLSQQLSSASTSTEITLTEKVEQLRKNAALAASLGQAESSYLPRPADRGPLRRSATATSPPIGRTRSGPAAGTIRRTTMTSKGSKHDGNIIDESSAIESLKPSATEPIRPTDKRLSERLGLGSMKAHRKGHSLIPRSVHGKHKSDSKVSTLAKHFEQLSREFERERQRDRKQRAAKVSQSRAFPKASSKPIVEVYRDVNEAVEQRGPTDEDLNTVQPTQPSNEHTDVVKGLAGLNTETPSIDTPPRSPTGTAATVDEPTTEADDDHHRTVSQTASDDDGTVSDVDHSLLDDIIPGAAEIAESLSKPNADIALELPKHEKTSLMKMLTNFWAERSASGWTPLDYPINAGDHIFADEDVIIREDEPSSLIAFTLQSQAYKSKLEEIRAHGEANKHEHPPSSSDSNTPDFCEDGINQAEVETSLLRSTGTHLSFSFSDGSARMQCKIFYAEQFDAVRRKCGVADRIVESLSRCLKWDSKGGKTKSVFLKTLDDRLVVKSLSPVETQAFLRFAPAYFNIMAEALFHELPTVIAKMLGFYQIVIKNPVTGMEIKWDVLVMENLFYDRQLTRIFDLKGSMRNRKIQSTGEQNEVLLDENMVEFIYESPLFAREVCHILIPFAFLRGD
jgi:1-phosphatidylinositol-3-phosphate 5-kinase